jgi:hypothetical protein
LRDPVGALARIAISVLPGSIETRLSPQPFWLDAELARLRDVCVAGGF